MATNSGGWLYEVDGTPVDKATADNAQARVLEIKEDVSAAKSDAALALSTANSYAGQIAQANTTAVSALATAQDAEATADNAADRVDALEVMGGVEPGSVNDANMKLHAEQDGGLFNTALKAQIAGAVAYRYLGALGDANATRPDWPGAVNWYVRQGVPDPVNAVDGDEITRVEFSPGVVPGLTFWYDAREITATDGAPLSRWDSGFGPSHVRYLIQPTASRQPTYHEDGLNGHPSVLFDGVDDFMRTEEMVSYDGPVTVYAVAQSLSAAAAGSRGLFDGGYLSGGTLSNVRLYYARTSTGWQMYRTPGEGITGGTPDDDVHLHKVVYNGASSYARVDGTQTMVGTTGNNPMNQLFMGARADGANPFHGHIGALLVIKGTVSAEHDALIVEHLTDWGL